MFWDVRFQTNLGDNLKRLTRRAHVTSFLAIISTVARLAYTRVALSVLSFLANTLVQTLVVGTHIARAQSVLVHRVLHQVVRAVVRFEGADTTWGIGFDWMSWVVGCMGSINHKNVGSTHRRIQSGIRRLCVWSRSRALRRCTSAGTSPFPGKCRGSLLGTDRFCRCTWFRVFSSSPVWRCAIRSSLRVRWLWLWPHRIRRQTGIPVFRSWARTKRSRPSRRVSDRCRWLDLERLTTLNGERKNVD